MRDHKKIMNVKVKNMRGLYNNTNTCGVVKTGKHRDVRYWITTMGIHPCAYVECTSEFLNDHRSSDFEYIGEISIHGGVTFIGKLTNLKAFNGEKCYGGKYFYSERCYIDFNDTYAFGWDYGHCGDWAGYRTKEENERYGHKLWTVEEIKRDCRNAIDQMLSILENDQKETKEIEELESGLKLTAVGSSEAMQEHLQWLKTEHRDRYLDLLRLIVKEVGAMTETETE